MGAYGALESSEHGVGMLVLHRDDEVGWDGGAVFFFVMMWDPSSAGLCVVLLI